MDLNQKLRLLAANQGVLFLDPFDVLCNSAGCLATLDHRGRIVPTAWDYGHLTAEGASLIAQELREP